jgi:hypothetical protein
MSLRKHVCAVIREISPLRFIETANVHLKFDVPQIESARDPFGRAQRACDEMGSGLRYGVGKI